MFKRYFENIIIFDLMVAAFLVYADEYLKNSFQINAVKKNVIGLILLLLHFVNT